MTATGETLLNRDDVSIDERAIVETDSIGPRTRVWPNAHVMERAVVGCDCDISEGVFIEPEVRIGDNVVVKNGVSLWTGVVIEDDVFIGPSAVFTNISVPRSRLASPSPKSTLVRRGATIGANATVLPGVTIGEYAFVGAGPVVTRDVGAHTIVIGNPARAHGYICRCDSSLRFRGGAAECGCGLRFKLDGGAVVVCD